MACPVVAAVASMVRVAAPELSAREVRDVLCKTAADLTEVRGKDDQSGWGAVDAEAALKKVLSPAAGDTDVEGRWDGTLRIAGSFRAAGASREAARSAGAKAADRKAGAASSRAPCYDEPRLGDGRWQMALCRERWSVCHRLD